MPTYEYECQKCGFTFELMQGINDKPRSRCPLCRGRVQRLIGAGVGVVFKGSGFYVTDSRSRQASGQSPPSSNGKAGSGEDKSTTSGSSDAKSGGASNLAASEKSQASVSQDSGKK